MTEPIVDVQSLAVRYGSKSVLDGVSFKVREGQVLAIVGRNGAGKSSLLRCLLGQQRCHRGGVRIFGLDVMRHRGRLMSRVGAVPEVPDAPPRATARQLESVVGRAHGRRWDRSRFKARLDRFGIPMTTAIAKLARGQQTQLMLALALTPKPDLLVLDDPTLGLDAVARQAVIDELVDELSERGIPMVVASHDLLGLERLATHIAMLAETRVVLIDETDALKQRLRWISVPGVENETPVEDAGGRYAGTIPSELNALKPIVARRLPGKGREVLVQNFEASAIAALEQRLGRHTVEVRFASLEDLVVSLSSDQQPSIFPAQEMN